MLQIGLLLFNLLLGGVSKSVPQAQLMLTVHDIDELLGFLTKGGVKGTSDGAAPGSEVLVCCR